MFQARISDDKKSLIIELPLSPRPSKSGKTILIAGTGGFVSTPAVFEGKNVKISVNATIDK